MTQSSKKIEVAILIKNIAEKWLFITSVVIAGGLIGFFISFFLTPKFESGAVFSVTIDYTQTGALSDAEEDQAMRGVGSVLFSDDVVEQTLEELDQKGAGISKPAFTENAFSDREEFRWTLRFRSDDPEIPKMVVDSWSSNADQVLQTSLNHALIMVSEYELLNNLEMCLQRTTESFHADAVCGFKNISELQKAIEDTSKGIQYEKQLSRGLFSYLSITLVEKADIYASPVSHSRNDLVFGGAVIGLLSCILILAVYFLKNG